MSSVQYHNFPYVWNFKKLDKTIFSSPLYGTSSPNTDQPIRCDLQKGVQFMQHMSENNQIP